MIRRLLKALAFGVVWATLAAAFTKRDDPHWPIAGACAFVGYFWGATFR